MAFLTADDLRTYMFTIFIGESKNDFNTVDEEIELNNIEFVRSKIGNRYDCDNIFSQSGEDRNRLIVKILTILVLYDLVRRNPARKVPEDFREDWKWAIKWLDDVRDGKESPSGLPQLNLPDSGNLSNVLHGNNRNNDYFL